MLHDAFPDVLAAARAGAGWAATRLYEDLAGTVRGYLRLQGATEPDDLTSEVFVGVLRGLGRFDGDEAAFRSWVFTIAHRRLTDERRRAGRRPVTTPLTGTEPVLGGDVEAEALAGLADPVLREAIEQLTPDQRDVVLLRVVADLSLEETATVVGRGVNAVKQLQRRGLLALRRALPDREVAP